MTHLVLLHGWGATGAVWRRQAEALGKTCNIHSPDIPAWNAAWIQDFLGKLPLHRTVAVGWSLGGMLLLEALACSRQQLAGLILTGVPAVFCRQEDHPWGQPPAAVRAMRRGLKMNVRKVLEDFAGACLAAQEAEFKDEVKALFASDAAADHLAAGLDYLLAADLRSRLPKIANEPVLVHGDMDAIVPADQAVYLSKRLPGSRLILLPGVGHLPFVTQWSRFNEILIETLEAE
ncbi:MAG: alpha/beta fold hydrolase [Deltaproteobacteria bacterium]|nr:alpha/beta fold hydrolase [Deltaproteobacteria bacterium]